MIMFRPATSIKNLPLASRIIARNMSGSGGWLFEDSSLTKDQLELRDSVHSFMSRKMPTELSSRIDRQDSYPEFRDFWRELGSLGLHGITVPSKWNGLGLGYLEHCLAVEALSQYNAGLALSYGAHSNLTINQISLNGTNEQRDKYLPKLISGQWIGSLAMSEPEAGSDVTSMRMSARQGQNGSKTWILNGSKFWITNGPLADLVLVYAKTGPKQITAFLVETNSTPGFSVGKKISKMGMRGSPTGELIFDECPVPEDNIVGQLHEGVYVLMSGLDYERLVLAAGPLGIMQRACDMAFDYAHQRRQFNKPIGHFQLIQGLMADMYTETLFCRSSLYSIARELDNHKQRGSNEKQHRQIKGRSEFTAKCAAVILRLAESGSRVADSALQILGGNGYTEDYEASRLVRDARLYQIGAGTSEIRRWLIGREINRAYDTK